MGSRPSYAGVLPNPALARDSMSALPRTRKRKRSHEIEQSQLAEARYITLSPIHMPKDDQRQSPPRPFMISQIRRECPAYRIECNAHGFQGFGIVDIFNVAERGHFVFPLCADASDPALVPPSGRKASPPCTTFHAVREDCKSGPGGTTLGTQFPKSNRGEFAPDALDGSVVPPARCMITSATQRSNLRAQIGQVATRHEPLR